jgi:hypothetical protein
MDSSERVWVLQHLLCRKHTRRKRHRSRHYLMYESLNKSTIFINYEMRAIRFPFVSILFCFDIWLIRRMFAVPSTSTIISNPQNIITGIDFLISFFFPECSCKSANKINNQFMSITGSLFSVLVARRFFSPDLFINLFPDTPFTFILCNYFVYIIFLYGLNNVLWHFQWHRLRVL